MAEGLTYGMANFLTDEGMPYFSTSVVQVDFHFGGPLANMASMFDQMLGDMLPIPTVSTHVLTVVADDQTAFDYIDYFEFDFEEYSIETVALPTPVP